MEKYKNIVFIPARGGSKSIPGKNIKEINGKPLIYWAIMASCRCRFTDMVYVATDDRLIRETVEGFGVQKLKAVGRSEDSATDTASTELAMLQFAKEQEFENIILVQATSPMLTSQELEEGIQKFREPGIDSVLSVVRQRRFCWERCAGNRARPLNYDVVRRPRRQEFEGFFVENGAFYITSKEALLRTGCRLSGNIGMVEMQEDSYYEIDEPKDWEIVEHLLKLRESR